MSELPWIKSYPAGVRWDAELPTMPVPQILANAVERWPDQAVIDFMGRKISYRELDQLSDRAAAGLQKLGVGLGVHVGLYLPNTPHYIVCFFGVLKAGGVVVNYSPLDAEKVLAHKVEDSETDIIVTLDLQAMLPQMERHFRITDDACIEMDFPDWGALRERFVTLARSDTRENAAASVQALVRASRSNAVVNFALTSRLRFEVKCGASFR